MTDDRNKEMTTLLVTFSDIEVSNSGVKFLFGEISTEGIRNYHTSVFLPMLYVSLFEKDYKSCISKFLEIKTAQQKKAKKKKNAV